MWISNILSGWKRLLQRTFQSTSNQRLAIALIFSVLLHLFLMGKFAFNLADTDKHPQLIEARLVLPPPIITKPVPEKIVKKSNPAPVKKTPFTPIPAEPVVIKPVPEVIEESDDAVVVESTPPDELPAPSDAIETKNVDEIVPEEVAAENQEEELGVINPQAYKYVEALFDVRTQISANANSSPVGKATMVYELHANGEQYQLKSLMQASGLAALVIPDLLQTSEGFLSNLGLQPKRYVYQFGDKKNKTYTADFDWEQKKLTMHTAKGDQTVALVEGTQDLLSFMYQFMFVPPLQNMQLNITNGKKLGTYDYFFEAEETIDTKMGKLSTIHIARTDNSGDEKTELWLALDYQYVPVKIRKTEKESKVYEMLVTSLKTEKPVN